MLASGPSIALSRLFRRVQKSLRAGAVAVRRMPERRGRAVTSGAVGLRGRTRFHAAAGAAGRGLYAGKPSRADRLERCARRDSADVRLGRDIPGEWWRMFHSVPLNASDRRGLQGQSEPAGGTSGAVAGQGKSLRAGRQALPASRRQCVGRTPAVFAAAFGQAGPPDHLQSLPGDGQRLLRARHIRRRAAADRSRPRRRPNISASSSKRPI